MAELKDNKRKNGKLSLYPIKFHEAVKDLLKVKPSDKRIRTTLLSRGLMEAFDYRKATQCLNFFASKAGKSIDRLKVLKLIYFADRYHLRKYGRLITNDIYFAMELGPVASSTKDIAERSEFLDETEAQYANEYLRIGVPHKIVSNKPIVTDVFSESDIEALNFAWNKFGHLNPSDLVELTHKYPEWGRNKQALSLNPRIEMKIEDFLDDPIVENVEKCFELTDEDRKDLLGQLEEMRCVESLWR